jgi:hypothetical protein
VQPCNIPMESEEVFPACQGPGAMGLGSRAARLTSTAPNIALEPTPNSLRSCVTAVLGAAHRQRWIAHGTRQQADLRTTLRVLA